MGKRRKKKCKKNNTEIISWLIITSILLIPSFTIIAYSESQRPEQPSFPINNSRRIGWEISYRNNSLFNLYPPYIFIQPNTTYLTTEVGIRTGVDARIIIPGKATILSDYLPWIIDGEVYLNANSTYYKNQDVTVIDSISKELLDMDIGIGVVYGFSIIWEQSLSQLDFDTFRLQLSLGNILYPAELPERWFPSPFLDIAFPAISHLIPDFDQSYPDYKNLEDTNAIRNGTIYRETRYLWRIQKFDQFLFTFDDTTYTQKFEDFVKIQSNCDFLRGLGFSLLLLPVASLSYGIVRPKLQEFLEKR